MVIQFILLLISYSLISPVYAQDTLPCNELKVNISRSKKQAGQYFRTTLAYCGPLQIENIKLDNWRENFAIFHEDEYSDTDSKGRTIQVLKLRLYPRTSTIHQLPALKAGNAISNPVNIQISPAVVKNSAIELNWSISSLNPWQREAVVIQVELKSSDTAAHAILDSSGKEESLIRAFKTERQVLKNGIISFNAGWIYYPAKSGFQSVELPAIRYQLSGSDLRRFYLPLQKLNVKPLPTYIPPDLPIGKLNISSYIENNDTAMWKITVQTPALIPYGLSDLNRQLSIFSDNDIADIKVEHKKLSDYNNYGDLNIIHAALPEWVTPFGKNFNLNIRYFNPETGKLEKAHHRLPWQWNMPRWAWGIIFILAVLFILVLSIKTYPWVLCRIRKLRLHQQVKTADSPEQLRKLIIEYGQYITLYQWAENNPEKEAFAARLNEICFSVLVHTDLQKLKSDFLNIRLK